jgi:formylglycine-generating enzyme required for sulfatase activity/polyisoprenoid-binding protein YceI
MKKALIVIVVLLAIAGIVYLLYPSDEDVAQKLDKAGTGEAKQAKAVEVTSDDTVFDLSIDNTKIGFTCAKDVAGKTMNVVGGWSNQFGSKLDGKIVFNSKSQKFVQVEANIDVGSLWSEHELLTDALLNKGFFNVKDHPIAKFISTEIREGAPEDSSMEGATHEIEGNFNLNGIEKSITFPAKIEVEGSGLVLKSEFSLNRKDFDVNFTKPIKLIPLKDENIAHLVALKVSVKAEASAPVEAVAKAKTKDGDDQTTDPTPEPKEIDISKLPKTYSETIPVTQVNFDMVLVPGDAEQEVAPLYFGKYEVTWDEFMPWVDGRDIGDEDRMGELRAMKLRPSPPYGAVDRNFGTDGRPALGMSRLSAELYCKWVSEQTGKTYRLPTEKEWAHAFKLGGGNLGEPPSEEDAKAIAVFYDNSWDDSIGDWATKKVGSMKANSLGLHDMAGNVCEWVTETNGERVARGGHFDGELKELGVGRHIEDPDDWNRDYPNEPKSIWWFVNARWVGFRLVSDVSSGDAPAAGEEKPASPAPESVN